MKKHLFLFLLTAFSFFSCSDDDAGPTQDTNNESSLIKIIRQTYIDNTVSLRYESEYSEGRIVASAMYAPNMIPMLSHIEYTYNENGTLASNISYYGMDTTLLLSSANYTYDNQGRISGIAIFADNGEAQHNNISYTYNPDSTVTVQSTNPFDAPGSVYFINSNGLVYKQVGEFGDTSELIYEGTNPVSMLLNESPVTFDYDTVHDPSLLGLDAGAGDYMPNIALRAMSLAGVAKTYAADKYLIRENHGETVLEYIYTFNDEGLPIKRLDYRNDVLESESDYIYE